MSGVCDKVKQGIGYTCSQCSKLGYYDCANVGRFVREACTCPVIDLEMIREVRWLLKKQEDGTRFAISSRAAAVHYLPRWIYVALYVGALGLIPFSLYLFFAFGPVTAVVRGVFSLALSLILTYTAAFFSVFAKDEGVRQMGLIAVGLYGLANVQSLYEDGTNVWSYMVGFGVENGLKLFGASLLSLVLTAAQAFCLLVAFLYGSAIASQGQTFKQRPDAAPLRAQSTEML